MPGANRLTVRLIVWLALVQVASVMIGMAVWMLFSPYVTFGDVAAENARQIIAEAVDRSEDGRQIVETEMLRTYRADRPRFRFAASHNGRVLAGSTPELARYVASLGKAVPQNGRLRVEIAGNETDIIFEAVETRGGLVTIATSGNAFRPDDIGSLIRVYLRSVMTIYLPAIVAAILIVPMIVHRTLHPLRGAGRAAEMITIETIDQRLPQHGMPRELAPFIASMNRLLARLGDGVATLRLFTANAAHELRTPTAILAARIEGLPPGPTKSSLERDCRRIAILTDQLLAATRMNALDESMSIRVDLVGIARNVVADIAPLAIRNGRAIELLPDVSIAPVNGNSDALATALRNLCDNALRAEPEGGTVTVSIGVEDIKVWIEVADSGPGIKPEDVASVFEPFWRKGPAQTGTGLGLSIVRQIVDAHAGRIEVLPTGKGTTMRLELPHADKDQAEAMLV